MAYASVAQTEHETTYNGNNDLQAASPTSPTLPEFAHRPLSSTFEEISGAVSVIDPTAKDSQNGSGGFGNILRSISSSSHSYEVVEDDDHEDDLATPRKLNFSNVPPHQPLHPDAHESSTSSEQRPVRTASVSRHLPLNHPIPDLQSMQGAYVKNVERLEESAERLSMTSSLEDELHRTRSAQRRVERTASGASSNASRHARPSRQFSTSSYSNSIIGVNRDARTGGYAPSGYITSPIGSIRSGSWAQNGSMHRCTSRSSRLAQGAHEPELEGRPLDMGEVVPDRSAIERPNEAFEEDRRVTSASYQAYNQRDDPFADFDGSHYNGRHSLDRSSLRRISLQHPPLARDSKAYREAQPGEKMIYYPAPVPVMLNLPNRLSKANFGDREKRRTQALSGIPDEMRKSAAWLSTEDVNSPDKRNLAVLPPQLRASAFFDQQSTSANIELKNGSAVQTLDSILDAAAHAPVSAFTDHPIVGHLGREVYGTEKASRRSIHMDKEAKTKRRNSLSNMLKSRKSNGDLEGKRHGRITSRESKALEQEDGLSGDELEQAAAHSIAPGEDETVPTAVDGEDDDEDAESSSSEHRPGFSGAPTTLLAELQMRKEAQKQRNRTAADAFPNGMHSTLLELDAVTQLQQKSRKQKHVTLAWEDHDAADRQNFDDDDVPLAVLFPEKERPNHQDHRPMGLMEKKEREDNEPLSHRRARLRGEPVILPRAQSLAASQTNKQEDDSSKYKVDLPGMSSDLDEPEQETLAQRRKRMKEEKERVTAGNFASDVASQLGLDTAEKLAEPPKTPEAEETLGQRRARLKEEAAKASAAGPQIRTLADVLQAHPVGARQISSESQQSRPGQLPRLNTFGPAKSSTTQLNTGFSMPQLPAHMATLPYYNHTPYMNPAANGSARMLNGAAFGTNGHYGYGPGMQLDPMNGPPLDPQQRALIDRWRQGIM